MLGFLFEDGAALCIFAGTADEDDSIEFETSGALDKFITEMPKITHFVQNDDIVLTRHEDDTFAQIEIFQNDDRQPAGKVAVFRNGSCLKCTEKNARNTQCKNTAPVGCYNRCCRKHCEGRCEYHHPICAFYTNGDVYSLRGL